MINQYRNLHFWAVLFLDLLLLALAHFTAYSIRFEGAFTPLEWANIRTVLPWLVILKLIIFLMFGLYRGMWRYTSLTDLVAIIKASVLASTIALGAIVLTARFEGFSRAVFVLDGLLTILFITGIRISIRLFYQGTSGFAISPAVPGTKSRRKRLLIIGAGDAAEKVLREIRDNRELPYDVAGLLDDNRGKQGRRIHGIGVLGTIADLKKVAESADCQEILIAIPSASREQMSAIVELCQASGLPYKTLPGMGELIDGKVSVKAIRDVAYKDLLGRPPVRLESERIEGIIRGRTVLVTGAGGSIGSELCRQILRFQPGRLLLLDSGEQNLYQIEMEILHEYGFSDYVAILGKVQDRRLLEDLFASYRPAVIFHAAAYKHVPMIERNPWQAVSNNILATRCLMETAVASEAERFILVSTDKAVRPTNVMGASKRLTELLMQAYCRNGQQKTRFMAVRFGNVLGSSGSVIPLFRRQIEMGGPITVTDPEITRYFMSIEEAAQLILQAATMEDATQGNQAGGEIFILEMGTPVRIVDMARTLIRLCGKEPDVEIEIKFTGLRPGEKLYEELITDGEGIVATDHEKIMVLRMTGTDDRQDLNTRVDELAELATNHDAAGIKRLLQEMIPEYSPKESVAVFQGKSATVD